jgi:transcriptional regulator with XRE-family HTH domain
MGMTSQGKLLRKLRKDKSLTLSQLASEVGRSVGYLSQIERGISYPQLKDLVAISVALDVSLATILPDAEGPKTNDPGTTVLHEGGRRRLASEGILTEALTPTSVPNFDFMKSVIAPGISTQFKQSPNDGSMEIGYIVSGSLELMLNGEKTLLKAGDSYSYRRSSIHYSTNTGTEDAVVIWCVLYS